MSEPHSESADHSQQENQRIPIIVANWKMYKTIPETEKFLTEVIPLVAEKPAKVLIAVPFTSIRNASLKSTNSNITIGAQNMNDAAEGAFTGEIAAKMLVDAGAKFVILGHSERRNIFGETNQFINRKIKQALENKLQPILCIGESLEQREAAEMEDTLATQLQECLDGIEPSKLTSLMIAYEPIWAIGTGKSATPAMAQEAHLFCREYLTQRWGQEITSRTPILYGGSVKPDTAGELLAQPDIDGLLVGGASLNLDSFAAIINAVSPAAQSDKMH